VKIAENLLLVVPLGSADLKADLAAMNAPALEQFHLILGNIMIEKDQAAVLAFGRISLTTPRRVKLRASCTASTAKIPRY
jgi:hypothetical protein